MRSITIAIVILALTVIAAGQGAGGGVFRIGGGVPPQGAMTLTTPGWPDGGQIPVKYTQAVPNPVTPELK
jgi:hypothetical protein